MDLEYLIVGISKNSKEDFQALYNATYVKVYSLALATVKDKMLAREIAVETFRRVKTYAYSFDTALNAEYWMLDMTRQLSLNALRDSQLRTSLSDSNVADNASVLVLKTVSQLRNERGLLLILRAVTDLSGKDIATLSGFYRTSAAREARRGLKELRAYHPKLTQKELNKDLKKDLKDACPDYLELVELDRPTKVSHISHEAMYLNDEEASFEVREEIARIQERTEQKQSRRKRTLRAALIALVCILVVASGTAIIYRLFQESESTSKPERAQTGASIEMVEIDGILFYRDANTGIYAYDPHAPEAQTKLIYDSPVRDLVTDGNLLFFRNYKDGKIYSLRTDGTVLHQLSERSGTSLSYYNGYIYFNASDGIYKISVATDSDTATAPQPEVVYVEEVADAPTRFHIGFSDDGTLVFSAGADNGIYRVEDGVLYALYLDEAYYFQIEGNLLFFDAIGLKDLRYLYAIDLNQNNDTETDTETDEPTFPTIQLYSAAYYVVGNTIFYEGYDEEGKVNGLYAMDLIDGTRILIDEITDNQLHITDMYASDSKLYCYYSDGAADGARTLVARELGSLDKTETIF